jgi:hypothetical protein
MVPSWKRASSIPRVIRRLTLNRIPAGMVIQMLIDHEFFLRR